MWGPVGASGLFSMLGCHTNQHGAAMSTTELIRVTSALARAVKAWMTSIRSASPRRDLPAREHRRTLQVGIDAYRLGKDDDARAHLEKAEAPVWALRHGR